MVQLNLSSGQQRHIRVKPRISEAPTTAAPEASTWSEAETTAPPEAPPETQAGRGAGGAERPNNARHNAVPPGKAKRFSLGKETWKIRWKLMDGN